MELDRLRALVGEAVGKVGNSPRAGEENDVPSWREVINNALNYAIGNRPVYLVIDVFKDGVKDMTVSGSALRLSTWLADYQKTGKGKISFEINGWATDRNWSRSKADEV
jgi:hypothetical protein